MEAPVTTATLPASRITLLVEGTFREVKLSAQPEVFRPIDLSSAPAQWLTNE
jgi:hypothetical protein